MKQIFVVALLGLIHQIGFSAVQNTAWELSNSETTYKVFHPFHSAKGTSQAGKGKGTCNEKGCQFLIAVPVKTFDSGDTNRDLHMLEVTRGAANPMIVVHAKTPPIDAFGTKELLLDMEIEFAGKKKEYSNIEFKIETKSDISIQLSGIVPLKLSDFSIERPSLLTISIKDEVPVTVHATWSRKP